MIKLNSTKLLKDTKKSKINDLKDALDAVCEDGYDYQGNVFSLKDGMNENINLKLQCPPSMKNRYKFYNKKREFIDFENSSGFQTFKNALFVRKNYIMEHYNKIFGDIDKANTPQAVADIVIDFTEPQI